MDGITHINIYSKGRTFLGQALSNFADTPIETVDGTFRSIEGYWYWLGCSDMYPYKEDFRVLVGAEAKKRGREAGARDWLEAPLFKLKIYNAMLTKLILHDDILLKFLNNKLPFRHYYIFKNKIVEPKEGEWIINMWTFLQGELCKSQATI